MSARARDQVHIDISLEQRSNVATQEQRTQGLGTRPLAVVEIAEGRAEAQPIPPRRLIGCRRDLVGHPAVRDLQLKKARGVASGLEAERFVEVVVNQDHDHQIGGVARHLAFDHPQILAERCAGDSETIDLRRHAETAAEQLGQARGRRDLHRLDHGIADNGDARHTGRARQPVIANARVPALGVNGKGRGELVAQAGNAGLLRRMAHDAVGKGVARHIAW